jgi:hypothetical protein
VEPSCAASSTDASTLSRQSELDDAIAVAAIEAETAARAARALTNRRARRRRGASASCRFVRAWGVDTFETSFDRLASASAKCHHC